MGAVRDHADDLDELKAQVEDAAKAIEEAADLALRKIGNSAREVSNQAQTVIEAQSNAVQNLRETILDIEREPDCPLAGLHQNLEPEQFCVTPLGHGARSLLMKRKTPRTGARSA